MKSTAEALSDAANQDAPQVAAPDPLETPRRTEWMSDCLLGMRSQIRFTRADWP
jgi:hypothetical protein